ncbi:MAG: hypothetical protein PHU49_05630 [Syntrophorhabdaceae bacterium]|nr:hypothetical protein [Syntrophorhabdaceae bacterium]MDD5243478.1 hypothetical protein [Syntrophorhabdaceae bacterium]
MKVNRKWLFSVVLALGVLGLFLLPDNVNARGRQDQKKRCTFTVTKISGHFSDLRDSRKNIYIGSTRASNKDYTAQFKCSAPGNTIIHMNLWAYHKSCGQPSNSTWFMEAQCMGGDALSGPCQPPSRNVCLGALSMSTIAARAESMARDMCCSNKNLW